MRKARIDASHTQKSMGCGCSCSLIVCLEFGCGCNLIVCLKLRAEYVDEMKSRRERARRDCLFTLAGVGRAGPGPPHNHPLVS
jgi:hypothetical protein